MAKEKLDIDRIIALAKSRKNFIIVVVLLCVVLIVAFNFLFSKSYFIGCEDYCREQPHVACVGFWNISGEYPNCNCQFVCWSEKVCESDFDCQSDERCYKSLDGGVQVGDLKCHHLCQSNSDCKIEITPYCRFVNITIGGASDLVKICMMEQCAKDSDCPQPRCIGMKAVCESGMCKVVDLKGSPARCD